MRGKQRYKVLTVASGENLAAVTATPAELNTLDGVTAGSVTASKPVIVDSNKDVGDFRNLDVVNLDAGASGTAGTVDVFPATASRGKLIVSATNNTGNTNVTLTNAAHGQATVVTIPDVGLATSYVVQSTAALGTVTATAAELNSLDFSAGGGVVVRKITATVGFADFTDGGAAVGTYAIPGTIPAAAFFLGTAVEAVTGFAGDTSASLTIGDGTDPTRYHTGAIDVFADAATGIVVGDPSGDRFHLTAKSPTLVITTNAAWASVTAGSITLSLYYLS